jgi:hypothetical protein
MGRFVKIATLLAVYLAWICGTAFIALSCNAKKHTLCTHCCECHHEGCDKAHVETPHSCNHDHSNTVILYDSTKKNGINIEPIMLCIAAQIENLLSIEDVPSIRQPRHYERDIPIHPLHITARRGMRAPPVVA